MYINKCKAWSWFANSHDLTVKHTDVHACTLLHWCQLNMDARKVPWNSYPCGTVSRVDKLTDRHSPLFDSIFKWNIYRSQKEVWEQGNILTGVCLSIGGLFPGREGLCPEGGVCWGVSVQGGLCPGGSLSRGVSVHGVSVQGGLCQGATPLQ